MADTRAALSPIKANVPAAPPPVAKGLGTLTLTASDGPHVLELLATPPSSDCDDDDGANVLQLLPLWGQQQAKGSTPDTYGELFSALLREQRLLSLGLYRRRGAVEYVLTNPPKETRLDKRDRVYVVGKLPKAVDGDRGYNVPRRARTLPASMLSAMTDTQRHFM